MVRLMRIALAPPERAVSVLFFRWRFATAPTTLIGGGGLDPVIILAVLYGVTFILSAFISNIAVAVMLTPVGIMLATILNVDPRPFLVAICFGASCSFMTPMG